MAELEAQIAAASAPAVDPVAPFRNLTAWQELRADVLHGLDGLDNDQTNIVLGAIDYYMPDADSTALQAPVREVPGWQPIETAPKDGTRFLALYEGSVDFYHWQEMRDFPTAPVGWRNSFITVYPENEGPKFWMPLPAAPVLTEGE